MVAPPTLLGQLRHLDDLGSYCEDLFNRKRLVFNTLFQRFSVQELDHNERLTILLAYVVNSANVGVVQSGRGLGFALEASQRPGVASRDAAFPALDTASRATPCRSRGLLRRKSYSVPSVLKLGIPLGVRERATSKN
jgi:hypothetical protein